MSFGSMMSYFWGGLALLLLPVCLSAAEKRPYKAAGDNWVSKLGVELAENHDKVIRAYQYDIDDFSPSFHKANYPREWRYIIDDGANADKPDYLYTYKGMPKWNVSFSLLPLVFPLMLNGSLKHHFLTEGHRSPGITLGVNAWMVPSFVRSVGLRMLKVSGEGSLNMWGGSAFCILYKSVTPHIKLFGGYRLGYGEFRIDIPDSVLEEQNITPLILGLLEASKDFRETWQLNELLWGIDFLTLDNNEIIFYLGYEATEASLFCKTEYRWGMWTYGVGIHPDNVLIVRPYVRLNFRF